MFGWLKGLSNAAKNQKEDENETPASGYQLPEMSDAEAKIYDRATGTGKQRVSDLLSKREQSQCSAPNCNNTATQFGKNSSKGTCENHTPNDAEGYE